MTKTNHIAVRDKIIEKLEKAGVHAPEVILVPGGCLVQVISENKQLSSTVFNVLTELHGQLLKNESSFPYQIYLYNAPEDAFKRDAGLKTKPHDYESGNHTTYLVAQDAIVKMREIDVDTLMYGENRPFEFVVKSRDPSEMFSISSTAKYKELDIRGGHYNLENAKIEQDPNNQLYWRITLY